MVHVVSDGKGIFLAPPVLSRQLRLRPAAPVSTPQDPTNALQEQALRGAQCGEKGEDLQLAPSQ